jgi:hypothetical protein
MGGFAAGEPPLMRGMKMKHLTPFWFSKLLVLVVLAAQACGADVETATDREVVIASATQPLVTPGCMIRCEEEHAGWLAECNGDSECLCFADQELGTCRAACRGRPFFVRVCASDWPDIIEELF